MVSFRTDKRGGRIISVEPGEDHCIRCFKNRGDEPSEWYYFTGLPKGIYCRACAEDPEVRLSILHEESVFWLIDEWEYVHIVKGDING